MFMSFENARMHIPTTHINKCPPTKREGWGRGMRARLYNKVQTIRYFAWVLANHLYHIVSKLALST